MNRRFLAGALGLIMTADSLGSGAVNASAEDEIVEVFWQYPAWGEVSQGLYDVEDKLNEMMEKDIGVHVTGVPTGLDTSQQDAILQVSAGEQLDICLSAFTSIGTLVEKGLILPLDDLLEETGTGEIFLAHNVNPYTQSTYEGKVYGVSCGDTQYRYYAYLLKKKFAEKYGIEPDDDKIFTLDEIEEIMAKIKEGEEEEVFLQIPWLNTYEPLNYCMCEYDKLGGDMSYGVLMLNRGFDTTEIVNIFATPEYEKYCRRMYDWAQKGYISPNAAIDFDMQTEFTTSDKYPGEFGWGAWKTDMIDNAADFIQLKVLDGYIGGTIAGINWSIPITSGNPQKALEALAYIYDHKEATWLIQYGIEGENWFITDTDEHGNVAAKYASENYMELAYINPYGLWGNTLEAPVFGDSPIDKNEKRLEAQEEILANGRITPSAGYVFNASSVSAEVSAVQTVIAQYAQSFNAGALDPDKALPEFLDALEAAGINTVIAENQKQFDAWLAENK